MISCVKFTRWRYDTQKIKCHSKSWFVAPGTFWGQNFFESWVYTWQLWPCNVPMTHGCLCCFIGMGASVLLLWFIFKIKIVNVGQVYQVWFFGERYIYPCMTFKSLEGKIPSFPGTISQSVYFPSFFLHTCIHTAEYHKICCAHEQNTQILYSNLHNSANYVKGVIVCFEWNICKLTLLFSLYSFTKLNYFCRCTFMGML